jgi:formate dehydrogenase major subunit
MGSNMAECHPVGFQWVMEAKARGAKVIHIDPRFTRTSAVADLHVPIRAGSDIAFLGALVNYTLEHGREFREYVLAYTNASTLLRDDFCDTEDLDGVFSGWDDTAHRYDVESWQYAQVEAAASADQLDLAARPGAGDQHGSHGPLGGKTAGHDPSLSDPRCVFQVLRRHFARYTPEVVAEVCGVPEAVFVQVAETLCDNSGRDRTSAFCYAVGWTQHSVGVQYIRTAAILQLLLGNVGRPGGGILALRGHASIQGSTDIPTLYNILPGYLPMPHAHEHESLADFIAGNASPTGGWGHMDSYAVSLLKAWWGAAATADNDYCFDYLPRIDGDHSTYATALGMLDGTVKGFFVVGENPAVGSAHGRLHRRAFAQLDWMVVRDPVEIETASFWRDSPEIERGELATEEIGTEVFFLPAALHTEKDGSFTNTQRLLQWHTKATDPVGDCRSDLWFFFHLGRIIREKLAASTDPRDRPVLDLTWDYPLEGALREPSGDAVLREINGRGPDGHELTSFTELRADGSTSCGCWIYCGAYGGGVNQTARRRPGHEQTWVAPEWGWAWPANRRLLYNRASADPAGAPWSARKRYVWFDEAAGEWTGVDEPDFPRRKRPDYVPPPGALAEDAHAGSDPFIMQTDGRGWLYAPSGLVDGPLPTHYEPHESPIANPLYGRDANPARQLTRRPENPYHGDTDEFPYVVTTYRLTEHHTAGGMSRVLGYLSELQPEPFCEVSPELARERRLVNGEWATVRTARATVEVRVLVTDRIPSLSVAGRRIHQVGLPYHWGWRGITRGDVANDLFPLVLDPNVHIQEVKAATCDIRPGRRR